jgi:hypothetical protein
MIILLAAHFSRADQNILAALVLLAPSLLFIRQKWVIYVLQGVAYVGSIAWLYSAYRYIQIRIATGDDWIRLLIILGVVALYTFWAGYFLRSSRIDDRYGLVHPEKDD